jgi:hypothetical protein
VVGADADTAAPGLTADAEASGAVLGRITGPRAKGDTLPAAGPGAGVGSGSL